MIYTLSATNCFMEQAELLDQRTRQILQQKLELARLNPYRYKRIKCHNLFLFRIRISGKRAIYLVDKPIIKLICILDRKNDYNDLEKYLKKLQMG